METSFQESSRSEPDISSHRNNFEKRTITTTTTGPSQFGNSSTTGCRTGQGQIKERKEEDTKAMGQKVTFDDKVIIHLTYTWMFAHKQARERYWEYMAVDRLRFKRRIDDFEEKYKRTKS